MRSMQFLEHLHIWGSGTSSTQHSDGNIRKAHKVTVNMSFHISVQIFSAMLGEICHKNKLFIELAGIFLFKKKISVCTIEIFC